jgi:serine/threonine-protein kinase RsbT
MIGPEKPSRPNAAEPASRPGTDPMVDGEGAGLPDALIGLLERFVSASSASAMLRSAIVKAERATGSASLVAVIQQLELSTAILVAPSKRDEALAAIRAMIPVARPTIEPQHVDEPTVEESVVVVRKESDLNYTRMLAREACNLVGVRGYSAQKLVTAVSELARNIARYVGDGKLRFRIDTDGQRIIVIAEDRGPGIPHLDEVLAGNYRSKTGLGRGLLGVRNLADEFDIVTGPDGTTVKIAFRYT